MNIWIITHSIAPEAVGGSETQTLGLATELAKRHRVTVVSRRRPGLAREEERNGFLIKRLGRVYRLGVPLFNFTAGVFAEVLKNRRTIDILFAKTILHGVIASLAGRMFRIPAAVLIEGEREYQDTAAFPRAALRFVSRTTRLLVQTEGIRDDLERRTGIRAQVVPNGVYLGLDRASGDKVLYVGRLVRGGMNDKGVRFLIEAVRGTGLETLIIGDGPERASLEARACGEQRIKFIGQVPPGDVRGYLLRGFVLVLPSVYGEGLPNVVLEALAAGLPVVATKTAGIGDVIEHGRTGFLVEPGDIEGLRRHILRLWEDHSLRERMSEACLHEALGYDWTTVAGMFERIFLAALRSNRPA